MSTPASLLFGNLRRRQLGAADKGYLLELGRGRLIRREGCDGHSARGRNGAERVQCTFQLRSGGHLGAGSRALASGTRHSRCRSKPDSIWDPLFSLQTFQVKYR